MISNFYLLWELISNVYTEIYSYTHIYIHTLSICMCVRFKKTIDLTIFNVYYYLTLKSNYLKSFSDPQVKDLITTCWNNGSSPPSLRNLDGCTKRLSKRSFPQDSTDKVFTSGANWQGLYLAIVSMRHSRRDIDRRASLKCLGHAWSSREAKRLLWELQWLCFWEHAYQNHSANEGRSTTWHKRVGSRM